MRSSMVVGSLVQGVSKLTPDACRSKHAVGPHHAGWVRSILHNAILLLQRGGLILCGPSSATQTSARILGKVP